MWPLAKKIVRSFTANRAVKLNLIVYGSSLPICGPVEVDSVFGDFLGLFHRVLAGPLTGKPVNCNKKLSQLLSTSNLHSTRDELLAHFSIPFWLHILIGQ